MDLTQNTLLYLTNIVFGLNQIVLEPTRMNNTLNVILCTEHLLLTDVSILPPNSDHVSLFFEVFADLWEETNSHKNGAITL